MHNMDLTIYERDLRDPRRPLPRRVVLRYSFTQTSVGDEFEGTHCRSLPPRLGTLVTP